MNTETLRDRRAFLQRTCLFVGSVFVAGPQPLHARLLDRKAQEGKEAEVSLSEDLMREHGVLKRVLLVYNEAGGALQPATIFRQTQSPARSTLSAPSSRTIMRSWRRISSSPGLKRPIRLWSWSVFFAHNTNGGESSQM